MDSLSNSTLLSSSPSSITDLQQWLHHFTTTFGNHLCHDNNLPVCIFQLPHTLTSEKPDSYIPQHIGLGPLHHFRTDLYSKQEQLKIITAKTILEPYEITSKFQKIVQERLVDLVPVARCCYDLYFDTDDETLAWIFAVDALFLLDVLIKVTDGRPSEALADVVMVENQIPLVILVELRNALDRQITDDFDNPSLSNLLVKFCEARLPLKLATPITELDLDKNSNFHLLDCMYNLTVNRNLAPVIPSLRINIMLEAHLGVADVENAVHIAGGLFPSLNVFLQPILVVLKLPWEKIGDLIKKMFSEKPTIPKIDIPSASKLARIGKIEFCTNQGGIRDIKFDEVNLTFNLPVLELKSDSEAILRNMVAYEGLMFDTGSIMDLDLSEYVDLMCGIVTGVKDVKILREKNIIIKGDLGDEKIVKLFNGISKSNVKKKDGKQSDSELQKTITKVNNHFGNTPRVKVFRFIKKLFLASWKVFATLLSILSLVWIIVTGVCQVYECKGHFGLGNVRSVFAYATRNNQFADF